MDLFHTITQTMDTVLTCDWYDSFKSFKMDGPRSGSDDKLMDTSPGGETPQYESIKTETVPKEKQRGQLGSGPNTSDAVSVSESRGQQTADNIRYGQNVSESGMGGKTTTSTGVASQEGGYGGTPDQSESQKDTRPQQGYGPGSGVGA
ncbi:hypothetical protein HRR83_003598 [Exophiala dermatitidis]|uniref:Uncharacterized protein n=2 Tax=Exophiala dermatitidis TaxID=5970 RepID=H6BSN9_EXODN|nr:uncharacterized protein HMPREF1120_01585 [Exophiala dermatitidis NIH/UT8656]KAJ4522437.1 hypothetical protein HRR74_003022 [Exophiala dermatitidis]EHY53391.1 hypothetical protein HMPREF1120_01585 [Exophiala dermatitidis NIH/UT8656]KAJ4529762.1 hypothetical protein HRR73_000790 [Exophiala dermatitidis]KAJ4543071.1 hypothetical protein HRR77_005331 [Exophiala dermatitidis]KAJ4543572.1 hypothetical protein HRR76_001639 [Exophiala dermatitidis]